MTSCFDSLLSISIWYFAYIDPSGRILSPSKIPKLSSISFDCLETLKEKLSGKHICFELTKIKTNWVAEIIDSEGNHIELTAPDK